MEKDSFFYVNGRRKLRQIAIYVYIHKHINIYIVNSKNIHMKRVRATRKSMIWHTCRMAKVDCKHVLAKVNLTKIYTISK